MNRRNQGFTLLEMLVVIAIFGFVLAGTSKMLVSMLGVHQQQSKIAESNIEGIIGLELLRQDIGKAGYGLPWNGPTPTSPSILPNYNEATGNPNNLNDMPTNPPRGIVSANNAGWNGADYLVIKAANIATNATCNKWTYLTSGATSTTTQWSQASENLSTNERVMVFMSGYYTPPSKQSPPTSNSEAYARILVVDALGSFSAKYPSLVGLASKMTGTGVVYGIDPNNDLRMPFNRADYYVKPPTTGTLPQRCAVGTGILYKAVVNQSDGNMTEMPLLDCVADMQVVFGYDPTGTGTPLLYTEDIITPSISWTATGAAANGAQAIRDHVKEVRVYILAQEGRKDTDFIYPTNSVYVGGDTFIGNSHGRPFDLTGITKWQNYRWKIYTLIVTLDNLL